MNVLYIGFDIGGVGGIATYSRYQIRALAALGHRVSVVSLDKRSEPVAGGPIASGPVDERVAFGNKFLAVLRMLGVLARRRGTFDLVVLNHVYLGWFGLAARLATGAPYVINVYNIDILTRLAWLREIAFARANLVLADCQYTIDRLARFHRRLAPVGLLYDPVDTDFFRPLPKDQARSELARRFGLGDLAGRFVVLTVAALLLPPNKGHRQTIDALARLADKRFLYLVAGSGPDREAIARHAAAAGLGHQVKLLGFVEQAMLPTLYSAADAVTLVARGGAGWGEAVPLGLIEASACATPFVCGNEDGSPEAIDPVLPNGVAIGPEDVPALAAALGAWAGDPARAREMGANGVRVVEQRFRFERFVESQGELLRRHLGILSARPEFGASVRAF